MTIQVYTWEKGWMWGCSKAQRLGDYLNNYIAVEVWREYEWQAKKRGQNDATILTRTNESLVIRVL